MIMQSRRGFRDTARRVLALWFAFAASSAIAPCQEAFALSRQSDGSAAYAAAQAQRHAHQGKHITGEARTAPSGVPQCIETPSPVSAKIQMVPAPVNGAFSWAVLNNGSSFFESSSAWRFFTPRLDARPQVFLQTSRLLI